jgi:tetratricopeptide (TPR) repeat protein
MTARRSGLLVAAVTGLAALQALPAAQIPAGQTFRATTDVVTIDVTVRTGGTPVGGLTARDFVLRDNGVPQEIDAIELDAVPVDVTLVVDTGEDMASRIDGLSEQVGRIAALARPTDRIRLMSAGTYVRDVVPAIEAADAPPWPTLSTGGTTSAFDALAAALLRSVPLDRRHLVIAMMNGIDAISAVDAVAVRDIASRSDATLNIAQVDLTIESSPPNPPTIRSGRERLDSYRCQASLVCSPQRHFWVPYDERHFDILSDAAELTGGQVYFPSLFTVASASAIFERAFADYRRSYLLRYTPTGVARAGWHEVTVTMPNHPSYSVRARRGYSVEPGVFRAGASAADQVLENLSPAAGPAPTTIDGIVSAYDRADYAAVFQALRQAPQPARLIRDYREAPNPWPANPRREALFVLELAASVQLLSRAGATLVRDLLADQSRLIQHPIEPDSFERLWHWAAMAAALNANDPATAIQIIDAATARFPDEPRFVLGRAIARDRLRPEVLDAAARGERLSARLTGTVDAVLAAYDAAMQFESSHVEAAARKAWFLHRLGRHQEALALLDGSGDATHDPVATYLRHLFRARTLDAVGRLDASAAAYRTAMEIAPRAQSARVGLMTYLLRRDDRTGAEALAEVVQAESRDAFDPWWAYWSGDYRFYPDIVDRLRELTR